MPIGGITGRSANRELDAKMRPVERGGWQKADSLGNIGEYGRLGSLIYVLAEGPVANYGDGQQTHELDAKETRVKPRPVGKGGKSRRPRQRRCMVG